jgi:hypothetical protein
MEAHKKKKPCREEGRLLFCFNTFLSWYARGLIARGGGGGLIISGILRGIPILSHDNGRQTAAKVR